MEKISSILPASGRVTKVNLEDAPPVRSGVGAYGRKTAISAPEKDAAFFTHASSIEPSLKTYQDVKGLREQERARADQARKMADNFFVQPPAQESVVRLVEKNEQQPSVVAMGNLEAIPSQDSFSRGRLHSLSNRELGQRIYFAQPFMAPQEEVKPEYTPSVEAPPVVQIETENIKSGLVSE